MISQGLFFCGDKCVSMNFPSIPPFFMYTQSNGGGIAWKQTFQECFEFLTCHYPNCCYFRDAQDKVKSQHYKLLFPITENLLKKSYRFLKYARAYLRKGRYSPDLAWCHDPFSSARDNKHIWEPNCNRKSLKKILPISQVRTCVFA